MQNHTPRREFPSAQLPASRPFRARPRRRLAGLLSPFGLGLFLLTPAAAGAQTLQQIFQVMQDGGAWLSLPIEGGKGTYTGALVPTMGMAVEGWFQVADVNRGEWSIKVVDMAREPGATVVDTKVRSGQRVPVSYEAGPTVRMKVDVTWSEPADTLLWVWVALPEDKSPGPGR